MHTNLLSFRKLNSIEQGFYYFHQLYSYFGMADKHPYGKPVSVFKTSETNEVIVDEEELSKIFDHPEIQDRKIVILSTIGAFRGGKSFFLDYCLRFLYAHVSTILARQVYDQGVTTIQREIIENSIQIGKMYEHVIVILELQF